MLLTLLLSTAAAAQNPLADLPNLVANGGFEQGTVGWRVSIGPRDWDAAKGVAEVLDHDADAGKGCLRLNAREQDSEVDALSDAMAVQPKAAYLLLARAKQLAGEGAYKITIDWQDAAGRHIAYDNDWKGNDHPKGFADHGGVFTSPEGAAKAVIILGASKGAECLFDGIRLSALPGPPGEAVPDGSGRGEAEVPATIEAGAYGTFRFIYHPGEKGLPTGASVYLRRDNIDPRWSVPQTSDPKGPGYLTAKASNGALCMVQPGGALTVPCVTRISVVYPPLKADDTLTITYGDTSGGGPGAQAQLKAEKGLRFVLSVDGDRDDRPLDLPDTQALDVAPGAFAPMGFRMPPVVEAGVPFTIWLQTQDAYANPVAAAEEVSLGELVDGKIAAPQTVTVKNGQGQAQLALTRPGRGEIAVIPAHGERQRLAVVVTRSPARPAEAPASARAYADGGTYILANPNVRLLLPRNESGYGVAFVETRVNDTWKPFAALPDAGSIATAAGPPDEWPTQLYLPDVSVGEASVTLSGQVTADGTPWDVVVEYSLGAKARHIEYRCTVKPGAKAAVRIFLAPMLVAGAGSFGSRKDAALFPGLEYLTANEVSSGEYGVIEPYSERSTPHPLKVTLPLMGVAADGLCGGLFWDASRSPIKGEGLAQPMFLSPACRIGSGADAHMLALSTPLEGENPDVEPEPVTLEAGQTVALSASLVALPGDVTDLARYWFGVNGVPDPPPMPRSAEQEDELTVRGFLETAWDAEKKGWHNALGDPWGATYNDQMALRLWHYARANPQSRLRPKIDAELKEAFDAAGGMRGYDFAFHTGDAVKAWEGERSAGLRDAFGMAADGSYAYHPHTGNKMFTQAQAKSLGRDGEVNIGTCVMGLEPLMRRALITGDPFLISQGEKGLAYIDRFTRPQGAENWEVPLACPNLRAAALATRCYLYGYLLTGKEHYLLKARFWATTGLPFIYMWNADDRPIMRYASISVMGTSLYTGTWFGKPVQWVGLVYAEALTELAAHDDSFPWRKVAEGILTCAAQMQKTEADPCGHVGFYPDGYDVVAGKEAYHWCLAPTLIADVFAALHGPDPRVSTAIVQTGNQRVHITAPGSVVGPAFEGGTLRFTSSYVAGSTHEVLISPVGGVDGVLIDGATLGGIRGHDPDSMRPNRVMSPDSGWEVVPPGLLRIPVTHKAAETKVEVRGLRLTEFPATMSMGAIGNGDFEQGLAGWAPSPAERASESADARGGKHALLLDARGFDGEVQCPSAPMAVAEGQTYELTAWVKHIAGEGKYKVTIDWLGVGGHLAYANDWMGTNRPAAYTQHGGRFTAPPGAKAAVIILGVHPGAACLFDDISLK
jgi:hypothetical protein